MHPLYHFTPPAGWLNDPNGLVYYDGEYHLFYQHHPHSLVWGPMHWGHAVSRDLTHWEHLPIALAPDENGMIFSGSAVVDWQNTAGFGREALIAIFTCHKEHYETQNLAYSLDKGRSWVKYPGNPVLLPPSETPDFRDPKVFWHVDHWVMSLAAGKRILFFTSPNLKEWALSGAFGPGWGSAEGVWETPDLFPLSVGDGPETRWVLTVGVISGGPAGGSATQYFVGNFDGRTFTSENPPETVLWMDYGADFYAPQTWNDDPTGRRLCIGWMSNWQYARETPASEWRGSFSVPRELSLVQTAKGIRLAQRPVRELSARRSSGFGYAWDYQIIEPGPNLLGKMALLGPSIQITADILPQEGLTSFRFDLAANETEKTILTCDLLNQTISLDRSQSGQVDFHPVFAARHIAPLPSTGKTIHLNILIDHHSVEVFAAHGQSVITDTIFPSEQGREIRLFAEGGRLYINSLTIQDINQEAP